MNFVLSGLLFSSAMIYLDDVLVCRKTFDEMAERLEQVFKRLEQYNIKLKLKKCEFARDRLPFLGFLLTPNGIRPDPSNIDKIKDAPAPSNVREVRSFLGAANFYRKFIPEFSVIAKPLTSLLRKGLRFTWSETCDKAFNVLKEKLTMAPLLVYPDFEKDFILCTDASQTGCGAVLAQNAEGREAPIAFFSRTFSKTETRYSTVERELYSVVLALKHFKHLVYGHHITIYSDQRSLSWGIRQSDSIRMMKWITKLSEFDLKIYYRPGSKMGPADYLSRVPAVGYDQTLECVYSTEVVQSLYDISIEGGREVFSKAQLDDPVLCIVIQKKKGQNPQCDNPETLLEAEAIAQDSWYHPESGCLYKQSEPRSFLYVPKSLQQRILLEAHNAV
jgi:hypothetical protein